MERPIRFYRLSGFKVYVFNRVQECRTLLFTAGTRNPKLEARSLSRP